MQSLKGMPALLAKLMVFVLATTKNLERMAGLSSTWGKVYEEPAADLYFVLGTNTQDDAYVKKRCTRLAPEADMDVSNLFTCTYPPPYSSPPYTSPSPKHKVLYASNCVGTYFGIGPTCRCQEAMHFFLKHEHANQKQRYEWFAFMDDDVYMRPFALDQMLALVTTNTTAAASSPVAMVASTKYRSFSFSKRHLQSKANCSIPLVHDFPLAQPAFINSKAMHMMSSAISHHNALTSLHSVWGGSHDSSLGLLLWMFQIPTWSFSEIYLSQEFGAKELFDYKATFNEDVRIKGCFLFHKATGRTTRRGTRTAGHLEFASFLNDSKHTWSDEKTHFVTQKALGERGFNLLMRMVASGIASTKYDLRNVANGRFEPFVPANC